MSHYMKNENELFLHKSGLTAFKTCRLRFKYMYITNLRMDRAPELDRGTLFHDAAYKFVHMIDADVLFGHTTWPDRFSYLKTCISEPDDLTYEVRELMYNLAEMESKRSMGWKSPKSWFKPIWLEKYLETRVPSKYAGTLDRLDHYDDEYLIVGDYKSGGLHNISQMRQEMLVYAMIINNLPIVEELGKHVAYWCTIHPRGDLKEYIVEPFKAATFKALERNTATIWVAIDEDDFPHKVGEHCDWCPFLWKCWTEEWYWDEVKNE